MKHFRERPVSEKTPVLTPVLKKDAIEQGVASVAYQISNDYKGRPLLLIGVLKGAFIFLSDLGRQLEIPVEIDFVQVSSYEKGDTSSGKYSLFEKCGLRTVRKGRPDRGGHYRYRPYHQKYSESYEGRQPEKFKRMHIDRQIRPTQDSIQRRLCLSSAARYGHRISCRLWIGLCRALQKFNGNL